MTLCILCFLQQERVDIEEKYANLQEEAAGKTKKLKKVWNMLMSAKSEVYINYIENSQFCLLNHYFLQKVHLQASTTFLQSGANAFLKNVSAENKPQPYLICISTLSSGTEYI